MVTGFGTSRTEPQTHVFQPESTRILPFLGRPLGVCSAATHQTPISPATAQPPPAPMVCLATCKNDRPMTSGVTDMGKLTVSAGMAALGANTEPIASRENISAPSADRRPMQHSHVLRPEFVPIVMPLIADAWDHYLRHLDLYETYQDIPSSIRHGFDMGVRTTLSTSYVPPNHASALAHPDAVLSHI